MNTHILKDPTVLQRVKATKINQTHTGCSVFCMWLRLKIGIAISPCSNPSCSYQVGQLYPFDGISHDLPLVLATCTRTQQR